MRAVVTLTDRTLFVAVDGNNQQPWTEHAGELRFDDVKSVCVDAVQGQLDIEVTRADGKPHIHTFCNSAYTALTVR